MKEKEKLIPDKAILVSVLRKGESQEAMERSLDELCGLLKTAGGECFAKMTQNKEAPDPRTMIGSGKACELAYLCASNDIKLVVFDCELSPSQIRNLETIIGNDTRVIDRSMLILDIFALHAVTGEGKLQVELAQLKYTAPRLMGRGAEMSKLGGGIGTRGPGESQLETDRRHLHRRIHALE
jgi:GTP-binding protein HflX